MKKELTARIYEEILAKETEIFQKYQKELGITSGDIAPDQTISLHGQRTKYAAEIAETILAQTD